MFNFSRGITYQKFFFYGRIPLRKPTEQMTSHNNKKTKNCLERKKNHVISF